jgi:hypothetical protein
MNPHLKYLNKDFWLSSYFAPAFSVLNIRPVLDEIIRADFLQVGDELHGPVTVVQEEDDVETVFRIDHFVRKFHFPNFQISRTVLTALLHNAENHFHSIFLLQKFT